MVNTLVIVNGENFWADYFPELDVQHIRLQTCKWLLRDGKLWVFDTAAQKAVRVDNILWRLGAVRPFPNHRAVLELVRYAQIPCLNSPQFLLRCFDRLSMLNELREIGLPIVPFTAVIGAEVMPQVKPELPAVIKVGSYHAGYGKMQLSTIEQWQDMMDMVFITDDYFTIEPFIDYERDIRCLAIKDHVWALSRSGSRWKANTGIVDNELIPAPDILHEYTLRAVQHFNADVLALDILKTHDERYIVLECNEVPGLAGFPVSVIEATVAVMKAKISLV